MRLTTILTDLDGVVRLWPPNGVGLAEREAGLPAGAVLQAAFAHDLLPAAITGRISDTEWRRRVAEALAETHPHADASMAVERWSASPGVVHFEVLTLLRACRRKAPIVLVTNATSRLPVDLQQLRLTQEFDAVINSSVLGYAKPDPRVFEAALLAVGATPEEALFIDDATANVEAAAKLGIVAHPFTTVGALQRELVARELVEPETKD